MRLSVSVDLERRRDDALETLEGALSPGLRAVPLPKLRQMEPMPDSAVSILLSARVRPGKPNRFFNEEAFELIDPVWVDLAFREELLEATTGVTCPFAPTWGRSPKSLS